MEMIFQSPLVIARDNTQDQFTSFIDLVFQAMQGFFATNIVHTYGLVPSAAFQHTQHLNLRAIRIEILPYTAFKFIDQLTGLHLPFFFFMAVLQKVNKIPQFFQRIFILNNLPGEHIQLEHIQPFHGIPGSTDLFGQDVIDLFLIFFNLHFDFFPEFSQERRVHIFQNQPQIQLSISG